MELEYWLRHGSIIYGMYIHVNDFFSNKIYVLRTVPTTAEVMPIPVVPIFPASLVLSSTYLGIFVINDIWEPAI